MAVLFWGIGIFCLAFALHFILWKVHLPKRQIKVLLQIFVGTLAVTFLLFWAISALFPELKIFLPAGIFEYLHICLLFIALTLAYITTYSAVEVDSPSLLIITQIAKNGSVGLDARLFEQTLIDERLIKPRLKNLLADNLVCLQGNKYKLTLPGLLLVRIFIFYRRLLNAGKGG